MWLRILMVLMLLAPLAATASPLSEQDMRMARAAWAYFQRCRSPQTGLVRANEVYPYTTMWDTASQLMAYYSAEGLKLISHDTFQTEVEQILNTLATMPLYNGELPNREYHVDTAQMVDFKQRPSSRGTGWSSLDIGRLLIALRVLADSHPELEPKVLAVVQRWKFDRMMRSQELHGIRTEGRVEEVWQEGRLGYEQYSAVGLLMWGHRVHNSLDYQSLKRVNILGVEVPCDSRSQAFLTSEPFMLMGLEVGFQDPTFADIGKAVYAVQRKRFEVEGRLTAATEDATDRAPYFVYNTVYGNGRAWNCVDTQGWRKNELQNVSSKAAMAFHALWPDSYSSILRGKLDELVIDGQGVFAGHYENGQVNRSMNVNTNGVILESLVYIARSRQPFLTRQLGIK